MEVPKKSTQTWKRQILNDIERREQQRKKEQRKEFQRIYNRSKSVEFKTGDQLNMNKHFYMPKLTKEWIFGRSKNALAVYPVLCSRADFKKLKPFQLSRENIAKLAGISTVSVDKGVRELEEIYLRDRNGIRNPLLQREMVQDGSRRYWTYLPGFFRYDIGGLDVKRWRGNYFSFNTCIIESGVWAELGAKAKGLYLAMRSESWFDRNIYLSIEEIWIRSIPEMINEGDDSDLEAFRNRKWEVCNTTLKDLFELSKMPYYNTKQTIEELEKHGLVERLHKTKSVFKVWLRPEGKSKRASLNLNSD